MSGKIIFFAVEYTHSSKGESSMEWMKIIGNSVQYIEEHITDDITVEDIARSVNVSPFYFQKGFAMLCGYTVSEYIRSRRLALAGKEVVLTDKKIIDIALEYGYDSPDSFTKAFTRFHKVTPAAARKDSAMMKTFAPLKITFSLKGGYPMDYKIEKKDSFTVLGRAKKFPYDNAKKLVPEFWQEHFSRGFGKTVMGTYGLNIDESMGGEEFEYLIADPCTPDTAAPDGFVVKTVPAFTWAIFPCVGPMPSALQNVNTQIYSEWLPAINEYEFAAGYCMEYYDNPSKYAKGTLDDNYYCEIWIPVKHK